MIHDRLDYHLDSLEPNLLVDLVWSLCVLQQAKAAHLQSVLSPEFCTRLLGDQSPRGRNYQLKLIHINTTARLECAGYDGPLLPQEALSIKDLRGERKATPLQTSLKETLQSVAGDEAKARFDVDTVYGWQLDAEMVLNSDSQALPVADFVAPHLLQSTGSRPLPPGARRIAFMRWEFPNFSNRSKDLLGRFAMARRHLQVAGFLLVEHDNHWGDLSPGVAVGVRIPDGISRFSGWGALGTVWVPYYEWLDLKSEWQKAAFLRDRMNKAVAEDMVK
uniref:Uncharacterized protein n=1 Tax=Sphaerodactylus townsendi TaxID=933632 RepID=A0ACB8FWQ0_9SAUR